MQLVGIYIYKETPKLVRKVLEPGWYPFGNYKKPGKGRPVRVPDNVRETVAYQIYQHDGLPEITVNCIVGMNGSGKSTLLDIFYMTINNMAVRLLGKKAKMPRGRSLSYARGLYADFFFVCEDEQYRISCRDIQTSLYKLDAETDAFRMESIRNNNDVRGVLSNLFYTISTNYSLYAFNQSEYLAENDDNNVNADESNIDGINGEWLSGLFHKNDGYFTPIVITPFRENGNIDVQKENRLASQRIMALSLLQKAHGVSFIERYEPHTLQYELDREYKFRTEKNFQQSLSYQYNGLDIRPIIRSFESAWDSFFQTEHAESIDITYVEQYELGLFYMAYKTIKICLTYEDYSETFGLERILKHSDTYDDITRFVRVLLQKKANDVIQKILSEIIDARGDRNHITLKLSVCKAYIESLFAKRPNWDSKGTVLVSSLIAGKEIHTYNDAVVHLPPAFFKSNMAFCVKDELPRVQDSSWGIMGVDEFSLGKMSSGERQMLYSLSYVLYHIKNIQSVREDDHRVAYHNICLIFDEAELYFHPDYQRRFLGMLLEGLSWCNIDIEKIHSIQILIVTHSPFVLTDMLTRNSLYLQEGKREEVQRETFGANYYEMLNKSFFFKKRAIGDISGKVLGKWIEKSNENQAISQEQLALVGDELIRNYLSRHVQN